jgi:hypothetical protein
MRLTAAFWPIPGIGTLGPVDGRTARQTRSKADWPNLETQVATTRVAKISGDRFCGNGQARSFDQICSVVDIAAAASREK